MKTTNTLLLFVIMFSLTASFSCQKDDDLSRLSRREVLLNQLSTSEEINFFDTRFIVNANPFIVESIKSRGDEFELIDSLFNSLVELQISHPFAGPLINQIGYPVWLDVKVHLVDSLRPCITIPTVGINDSVTQGIITSVLDTSGIWYSSFIGRDTLYSLTESVEENLPAYLLGMIYFDQTLFSTTDSVILARYNDTDIQLQDNEDKILPRLLECIFVAQQFAYMIWVPCIRTFTENEIIARDDCGSWSEQEETWNAQFCWESGGGGGPAGVSTGFPVGGGGSGSSGHGNNNGNNNNNGNGSGWGSNPCPCGCNLSMAPYLCLSAPDLGNYNGSFINAFNDLLDYLSIDVATSLWLRNNISESTIIDYLYFINNHSPDIQYNSSLISFYQNYRYVNRNTPGNMSFTAFVNLVTPYFSNLSFWEKTWLNNHNAVFNNQDVDLFLQALTLPNVSTSNFQSCTSPNIDWECVLDEINWYYMPVEGKDFFFDDQWWSNPNLWYAPQDRPSYADFETNWPTESREVLYSNIGGEVMDARIAYPDETSNTCALRLSVALNKCGVVIPDIESTAAIPGTLKGDDGKYYFLSVQAITEWLKFTFGRTPNDSYIQKISPQDDPINSDSFGDEYNRGIYTMIAKDPAVFGAKGHCDKFNGARCKTACHWGYGKEYNLWVLQ